MSDPKRNLPSWMSSKDSGNKSKSRRKKQDDGCEGGENRTFYNSVPFSKLLEGVIFVLSGFVNPERSTLRSQALDMGAEYRPDWTSDCTLLICAFQNTPKFRQVESDCGTIVSKEWISECYNQKKLVDIEQFLMHAGKPWRKVSRQLVIHEGQENTPCEELPKQAEKRSQGGLSKSVKEHFPTSKIKEWAIEDLNKTISWLESQEEKPETSEVKAIAAEGVITCLQDAIEVLNDHKDISLVTEQWKFVPHVVKELAKLEGGRNKEGSLSKEELSKLAVTCKTIYEREYDQLNSSPIKRRKADGDEEGNVEMRISPDDAGFDSDSTIEMTEEEIELACKRLSSEYYEGE